MDLGPLAAAALVHTLCEFIPIYPHAGETNRARLVRTAARLLGLLASCWILQLPPATWPLALALTIAHATIDDLSSSQGFRGLLRDQGLHGIAIALYASGVGSDLQPSRVLSFLHSPTTWIGITGFAVAVFVGGTVVGRLVQPFAAALKIALADKPPGGLENAGRLIGYLERMLIFAAICLESADIIGFVVAAKAILRFPETRDGSRELSEYYLVGTLASVTWAVVIGFVTRHLLD